jgi:hypothetical protein
MYWGQDFYTTKSIDIFGVALGNEIILIKPEFDFMDSYHCCPTIIYDWSMTTVLVLLYLFVQCGCASIFHLEGLSKLVATVCSIMCSIMYKVLCEVLCIMCRTKIRLEWVRERLNGEGVPKRGQIYPSSEKEGMTRPFLENE